MRPLLGLLPLLFLSAASAGQGLVSAPTPVSSGKSIALTFDVCSGKFDEDIVDALLRTNTKATFFVTGDFIRKNPSGLKRITDRPDLFQIANHGDHHLSPSFPERPPFGLHGANGIRGIDDEILETRNIIAGFPNHADAYRGAGALYSSTAISEMDRLGVGYGGFPKAPDQGGTAEWKTVRNSLIGARPGDVFLIHATRPGKSYGNAIIEGARNLSSQGFSFSWWSEISDGQRPSRQR